MSNTRTWVWVVGVVVVIVVILGAWWWSARTHGLPPSMVEYGTSTSTSDSLSSPNVPVPTEPVPILPTPSGAGRSKTTSTSDATVASVAASLSQGSRFAALLSSTGVASELRGRGPYTVFVPDNTAFSLLPPNALNLSAPELKRLVAYHVVSGKAIDVNAQVTGTIEALSKDMLNFSVLPSDESARVNSAVALKAYRASNGIVYVISEVLLPPLGQ